MKSGLVFYKKDTAYPMQRKEMLTRYGQQRTDRIWNNSGRRIPTYQRHSGTTPTERSFPELPYSVRCRRNCQNKRTDWFVDRLYVPKEFFTPPFETAESLKARLESMYEAVRLDTIEAMGCFVCRK